ncbi:MAG: transcriptional regulator [Mycobacterium sp.]|nr:transcriptional regulator [Mycobacterium sp.]
MSETTPDLRTRRRLATEQDLHQAALTLMEHRGFAATTVDEIVAAAGVSQRTFFRYFATKEDAVLLGYRELDEAIDSLEVPGDPRAALGALLDFHQQQIDLLGQDEANRYVTLQRLINAEPALRDAVAARELASMERLRVRLQSRLPAEPLSSRLIAEIATAILRVTFDHWRARSECTVAELPALYREVRSVAAALVTP